MIEILVDNAHDAGDLRRALASVFSVTEGSIAVVDDIASMSQGAEVHVLCERSVRGGEFPLHLRIHLYDGDLDVGELEIARRVAATLAARCLISDDELNPYTMIAVTADGSEPAQLDAAKLDEADEYWLA